MTCAIGVIRAMVIGHANAAFGEYRGAMPGIVLTRPLLSWIFALVAFVIIAFGVPIIRGLLRRRYPVTAGSDHSWRTLVGRLNQRWLRITTLVLAVLVAVWALEPDPQVAAAMRVLLVVTVALQAAWLAPAAVEWGLSRMTSSLGSGRDGAAQGIEPSRASASTVASLRWLALLAVNSLVVLLALQNLGIDVTAMVAGLGIGGIAVALAVQNILGDLFASLTIALDKPFVVGDFIVVGSEMGTVEHVGIKTTRVRSLSGEQLVFGNSDLLSSRIRNYKRMAERRVAINFGVVYATRPETLEEIPAIVRSAVLAQSNVRFDRCHFFRFGDSSLDFETVYFIATPDYNAHMDAQQAVHLGIARAFRDRGIEFAFPSRTLYMVADSAQRSALASAETSPASTDRAEPR